jgi:catechol 2,3-dioxygenase-like lactoylglutathione lyase family enzyme
MLHGHRSNSRHPQTDPPTPGATSGRIGRRGTDEFSGPGRFTWYNIGGPAGDRAGGCFVDWTLELIVVPVSDVDRAKAFYLEQAGFLLHVDHRAGEDFRVVQLTPPGSACSIALMRNPAAGSVQGLHLVVPDLDAARAELIGRGIDASEMFHFDETGQVPGPDPKRANYNSFLSFSDPDGNGWLVQEVNRAKAEV